jgi:hypothetical protein
MVTKISTAIVVLFCITVMVFVGGSLWKSLSRQRFFRLRIKNDLPNKFHVKIQGNPCAGTVPPNKFLPCNPVVYLPENRDLELKDQATGIIYRSDMKFVEIAHSKNKNRSESVLVLMSDIVKSGRIDPRE